MGRNQLHEAARGVRDVTRLGRVDNYGIFDFKEDLRTVWGYRHIHRKQDTGGLR